MTLYSCEFCNEEKNISKATIVFRDGKWVCKEALCTCGLYMDSKPTEGMPSLKRTEASLSKKKRHERLWKGAKEKLIGERSVNENFN